MFAVSVQLTPFSWMVITVPTGPLVGEIDTAEGVIVICAWATTVPPTEASIRCGPPRSSGTESSYWKAPSWPTVTWASSSAASSQPCPPTRLPITVYQFSVTAAPAVNPRPDIVSGVPTWAPAGPGQIAASDP